jgi:hypothetical protein
VTEKTQSRTIAIVIILGVVSAASVLTRAASRSAPSWASRAKDKVVYVCACLKTKSCSCMTEAKTEGPCACGTGGGPPMKGVPKDSDWAKENRDALAN